MTRAASASLVLTILLLLSVGAVYAKDRLLEPKGASRDLKHASYWSSEIHTLGAPEAYQEFSRAVAKENPSFQHAASHAFGEALYAIEGIGGISVCDQQFGYGCFHQVTAEEIFNKGLGSIASLGTLCNGMIECLHGAGHGILAYLGYGRSNLDEALRACSKMPGGNVYNGCADGVIMEYDLRIMANNENPTTGFRHIGSNLYEPCDTLTSQFERSECYFWQPRVWTENWIKTETPENILVRSAKLCNALAGDSKVFCITGIGQTVPSSSGYNVARSAKLCATLSDELSRNTCTSAAAKVFAGATSRGDATVLCNTLTLPTSKACNEYVGRPGTPLTLLTLLTT